MMGQAVVLETFSSIYPGTVFNWYSLGHFLIDGWGVFLSSFFFSFFPPPFPFLSTLKSINYCNFGEWPSAYSTVVL